MTINAAINQQLKLNRSPRFHTNRYKKHKFSKAKSRAKKPSSATPVHTRTRACVKDSEVVCKASQLQSMSSQKENTVPMRQPWQSAPAFHRASGRNHPGHSKWWASPTAPPPFARGTQGPQDGQTAGQTWRRGFRAPMSECRRMCCDGVQRRLAPCSRPAGHSRDLQLERESVLEVKVGRGSGRRVDGLTEMS